MKIEAMDDETVQGIIQKAVEDAVDFIEAEITEPRLKSQRYYDGEVDIGYDCLLYTSPSPRDRG